MLCRSHHGLAPAEHGPWVYQLRRAQGSAALFALVTICFFVPAVGTGTHDIPVGQKLFCLLVVILFALLFRELTLVVERAEKIGCHLPMNSRGGPGVYVKRDAKRFKRLLDELVVAIHDILRGYSLGSRLERDGDPVFVGTTNKKDLFPF